MKHPETNGGPYAVTSSPAIAGEHLSKAGTTMILVIDAGAAAEIVLQRKHAGEYAEYIETADWVIAPILFISEITNTYMI